MMIPLSELDSVNWSALAPAFALSETETVEAYRKMCEQDLAQVWRRDNLHAITTVHATKTGRAIKIVAMAGEYDGDLVDEIECFGRKVGCNKIIFSGRKGWLKKRPDYKLKTVTMEKGL
jgi:hypothetical protein